MHSLRAQAMPVPPYGQLACTHPKGVHSRFAVRQFPTLRWGRWPDALRLPNTVLKNFQGYKYQTCPPCLGCLAACLMVGWWASGKLRPTQGPEFCAFPALVPDGADGAATGLYSWRSHTKAAFMSSPHPSPVAAKSLSVALWKVPAVVPGQSVPAGNHAREGDKSLEAVPRVWLTCNTLCSFAGYLA